VDGGRLDNRAESLIIVDAGSLGEATKNPVSLVPSELNLCLKIHLPVMTLEPTGRRTDKNPSVVGDQSIIFFLHGTVPG
jgi:hypothetical protein